jgi:hypothetical protein
MSRYLRKQQRKAVANIVQRLDMIELVISLYPPLFSFTLFYSSLFSFILFCLQRYAFILKRASIGAVFSFSQFTRATGAVVFVSLL